MSSQEHSEEENSEGDLKNSQRLRDESKEKSVDENAIA